MTIFNHDDYTFSAFFVPDDHSPSMAITKELKDLHIAHYGRCWGITVTSKKENAIVLSIYGLVAVDYACTPFIAITHIVFGSRSNLEFELDDCDNVLTEMYSYIIKRVAFSTECAIVHLSDVQIKYDSFLGSYNTNHISAIELIRPWIRKYSQSALSEMVNTQMCQHIIESNNNHAYRLVTPVFEPSFVEKWLTYGWDGPFFLDQKTCFVDTEQRLATIRIDKHPGIEDERDDIFKVLRYQHCTYMGTEKCYSDYSFLVKFTLTEDTAKPTKGCTAVSISLNDEQLEFVSKQGNRSKFIQKLISDEMGRAENVEHYKPFLDKLDETLKAQQETRQREMGSALSTINQNINTASNGAFHLFLAYPCKKGDNWVMVTKYTSKIEVVDRPFLNSTRTYKCLELTVIDQDITQSDWSPLRCDLSGAINLTVSPTNNAMDPHGIIYKCVAFNSEVRQNPILYRQGDPWTATIRLLIIDQLPSGVGCEGDVYPFDEVLTELNKKRREGHNRCITHKDFIERLEQDIVLR